MTRISLTVRHGGAPDDLQSFASDKCERLDKFLRGEARIEFVLELTFLHGRDKLAGHDVHAGKLTLQPREIESVADFLFAKVVGKGPMDRAACIEYFGSEVEACKDLK